MCALVTSKQVYLDLSKILGIIYRKTLRIHDLAVYAGFVNGLKAIFASEAFVSCCLSSTIL